MHKRSATRLLLLGSLLGAVMGSMLGGCSARPRTSPLPRADYDALSAFEGEADVFDPAFMAQVNAITAPPVGWRTEPIKTSDRHAHQVWLSPTGNTAYGVIYFTLPPIAKVFPLPMDWVLRGYLEEMRKDQGEAILLSKQRDASLPGVRFVAEGGLYRTSTNLTTRGQHGWAIYAGTIREQPIVEEELELAREARERTIIQVPADD